MTKTLSKQGIEFPQLDEEYLPTKKKIRANIMLNSENLETFPLR